jgi:Rod binding domain-containing protein
MEDIQPIFPGQMNQSLPVKQINASNLKNSSEQKKIQAAKDFESLLINNLLDEMKNTIGSWGFEKDGASGQIDGLFWLNLSKEISDQGGFGLWKDIYKNMPGNEQVQQTENSIGKE